jgi:hypothetical protein
MIKPKLRIRQADLARHRYSTLGMPELLNFLVESNLFDISYHNDHISTMRGESASLLYYNDKKIYVDFWEYDSPTWTEQVFNANPI